MRYFTFVSVNDSHENDHAVQDFLSSLSRTLFFAGANDRAIPSVSMIHLTVLAAIALQISSTAGEFR
jgi:hypothetical protein